MNSRVKPVNKEVCHRKIVKTIAIVFCCLALLPFDSKAAPQRTKSISGPIMCECEDKETIKERYLEYYNRSSDVFFGKVVNLHWLNPLDYIAEFRVKEYVKLSDKAIEKLSAPFKTSNARRDLVSYPTKNGITRVLYDKIYVSSTEDRARCGVSITEPGYYLIFGIVSSTPPIIKVGKCFPIIKVSGSEAEEMLIQMRGIKKSKQKLSTVRLKKINYHDKNTHNSTTPQQQ